MASFDEYRKKMNSKYGDKKEEKEEKKKNTKPSQPSTSVGNSYESYRSKMESKYNPSAGVDEDYINSFMSDAKKFLNSAESDYNNMSSGNSTDIRNARLKTATDLQKRSSAISQYLDRNKDYIDEETFNSFKSYLDEFDKASGQLRYAFYEADRHYTKGERIENTPIEDIEKKLVSDEDYDILFELSRTYVPYDRETAIANGVDEFTYNDIEAKRKYISEKYGVDLYADIYNNVNIFNDLMARHDNGGGIAYTTQDGKNMTWQSLYDTKMLEEDFSTKYAEFSVRPDFEEYSKGTITVDETRSDYDILFELSRTNVPYSRETAIANGVDEYTYNRIEGYRQYISEKYGVDLYADIYNNVNIFNSLMAQADGEWSTSVEYDYTSAMVADFDYMDYMTEEERAVLLYIYRTEGRDAALEWHNTRRTIYQNRAEESNITKMTNFGKESPFWASVGSVALNMGAGVEYITDLFDYWATGESQVNTLANSANAIRSGVSEETDWMIGNWDAFDFLYNTGMSMADSAASMLTFGPYGGVALGLSAAASATNEALNRGMTQGQAFWNGMIAGAFEGLFETASIGQFSALKETASTTFKQFAKNLGKTMLVNASEETLTEIANIAYDAIFNGDFSSYETMIRQYMDAGLSEKEAKVEASKALALQIVEAGASGALMGFGFGVVGSGGSYIANKTQYNKKVKQLGQRIIDKGSVEGLRSEASKLSKNKTIAKLSNKLSKKMSAKNVGKLAAAIQAETNARDKSAMVADLVSKGLSQREAKKVTEFVTRTAQGYEATEEEIAKIEKITDKLPDVEDSAEYSVDEYGRLISELESEDGHIAEAGKMVETSSEATASKTEQVEVEEARGAKSARESAAVGAGEAQSASVIKNAATKENVTEGEISTSTKVADAEESPVTLESASKKYGAQAGAMKATYIEGQDIATYDAAYRVAYDMGKSGVNLSYAMQSESTAYLTESQRELAHAAGVDASNAKSKEQDAANKAKANGKNRRRKGVVRGRDVSISDLKARFNDKQGVAYKLLSFYAEATGIDIVLYDSSVNEKGEFEEAQGKFKWSEDTIYIDINAGLAEIKDVNDLAKYTMMRTFSHEFVHFIEKWNPIWYNEFRKVVFDTLTERGENVDDLIATKQAQSEGMSYDKASREVVAEAMTDILPDAHFAEKLATKHKNIFYKLLDMLKEFVADLKAYFNSIGKNPSREANALKERVGDSVKYLDHIVELFDKVAIEAVENYQAAVAVEDSIYDSGAEAVNNDYETLASYGLTDEEIYSVLQYKSSESYKINEKLYTNAELNSSDLELMRNLDRALEKVPVFQGTVYRNMIFDSKESLVAFLRETLAQGYTRWASYTSTSKTDDGYEVDGDYVVHIEIDSLTGRDLSNIGIIEEQEVLLPRDAMFVVVDKLLRDDGHVYIKLQEVEDGQNETLDRRGVGGLSSEIGDRTREEKTDDRGGTRRVVQETIPSSRESERVDRGRSEEKRARAEVDAELDEKSASQNEIEKAPESKEEQSLDSVDEDTVQEQSREYLGGGNENGNLDNDRDGRRLTSQYAEKQVAESSGNVEVADRNGGESGGSARGSGKAILGTDSEGVGVDVSTSKKLSGTSVVDAEGHIIAVYHSTNVDFSEFSKGDIGFHFGSKPQAEQRAKDKGYENPKFIRAYLNIKNPVPSSRDPMSWNSKATALNLWSLDILNDSEYAEVSHLYKQSVDEYNSPAAIRLREILEAKGYDGIAYPNGFEGDGLSYIAFYNEQIIRSDFDTKEQNQRRTNTLTDRDALYMAAEKLGEDVAEMSEAERDALQIFKDRLSRLYDLQEERVEQGRLYKEQQFGASVDREAAARTLNRMHVLDDQIKKANEDVLSIENKKVLVDVLKKAHGVIEVEQKKYDAEILKRYRDRTRNAAAIKKYRERIRKDVNDLSQWILKPNNKDIVKHVPAVLKNSVIPFLSSIDFTSKQQLRGGDATQADKKFLKRLESLNAAMKDDYDVDGLYSGYTDLPADFMDKLESLTKTVRGLITENSGEFVINKMTSEELKTLASVVRNLKTCITQTNKFHANAMFSHVYEAGDNTIAALAEMASNDGRANAVSNFVFWQQIRPAFAFERFGEGGKAVYDGLRRGQAQLAFNTKKIVEFTEKAYTDKEVTAWEKEIKEIKISKGIVKMRVSDIMSFYELSKQPDSLRQMLGAGMRVATYTSDGKKISDNGHALIEQDITSIVDALTPRQKEVADALQKFMQEQGGAWGNYVSVARFGEELFTNEQYFPINSDGRHLQVTADEAPSAASLYALLNMSFTKSRNEKANTRIIVYSIFDVFANHMASMAQYNALALPVLDAIKWLNYQKTEDADGKRHIKDSVREQMDRVYGVPVESKIGVGKWGYAQSFVLNIIKAFSGTEAQGVSTDTMGTNALKRYNVAQVAYNLRVVVQQPLAITRAALLIDYESIMRGMKLSPSAIKQNIKEMREYSGIAAWKALGFYDVNISRGLADTIKHNTTVVQKIDEIGMWGAEKADTLTWAAIWSACKEEVTKKQSFKSGDVGFYEAVTRLFEEVVYKTQVVDSVLTKNEYLRSKGMLARLMGSFMSEPTTTASMVVDAVDKYNADRRRGMTRQQAWGKNRRMIGRTMYVYAMSAVILAAVQAVADAFRDDDEYEEWYEKWLEAFGGNLVDEFMPFNKLPILSDFYDLAKELLSILGVDTYGNPPQSVFMQWYNSLAKGVEILYDKFSGEDTHYTYYGGIYKLLQAVSGMSGLPMAMVTREIVTAWNNIVGAMAPSLKVKTYDPGEKNEIKYAYQDGYLSFDEAIEQLVKQELVDNENEAYFTVSEWEAGDGYSRYDAVYEAVRTGGDISAAMNELTSHGYTEKDVLSQVMTQIGKWYYDEESDYRITKQQAIDMLSKYTKLTDEEITKKVNKWSCVVVTGVKYDDIDDEFVEGKITASRAIDMYVRYGGMTKEDATNKVAVYSFVKKHPSLDGENISYSFVSAYTEYCEPQGIDVDVFRDVWQYNSSVEGDKDKKGNTISGSKKAKVLNYIDSLRVSKKQKDSLYYAFGYSASKIREAPWH